MAGLIYTSLDDLPIYNWYKLNATQDFRWLLITFDETFNDDLTELYDKLQQDYLDMAGASDERELLMRLLKSLIKNKADYALGKKYAINYIKQDEFQLAQLQKTTVTPQSIQDICAILSKFQGYQVNPKHTSVTDFNAILKLQQQYNNGNKSS